MQAKAMQEQPQSLSNAVLTRKLPRTLCQWIANIRDSKHWLQLGGRLRLHVRQQGNILTMERGVQGTMQNAVGMTAQCGHQAATAPRRAGLERQYAMQAAGCDCTSGMSDECRGQRTKQAPSCDCSTVSRTWAIICNGGGRLRLHVRQQRNILTKERGVQGTMQNAVGMTAQCGHQAATAPRRAGLEQQYAMQAAGGDCTSGMSDECRGQCTMQAAPGWAWTHKAGTKLWLLHGEQDLSDNMQWRRQVATARPAAKKHTYQGARSAGHNAECGGHDRAMRAPGCDCSTESRTWATICNAGGRRRLHVRHERWVQGTMHNAGCPRMGMNAQGRHQAVTAPRRAGPEWQYAMEAAGCDCTSGSKETYLPRSEECREQCTIQAAPGSPGCNCTTESRIWAEICNARWQAVTARPAAKNELTKECRGHCTMQAACRMWVHVWQQGLLTKERGAQGTMHKAGCLQAEQTSPRERSAGPILHNACCPTNGMTA